MKINTRKSWDFHARENFSGETIYISESRENRELHETINFSMKKSN